MKRSRPLLAAALLSVALAAAGCGSSSKSSSSSSTPASTPSSSSTPAPSSAASSGGKVAIKMQNIAFEPKQATAKVGQTIVWTNEDNTDHNVTAQAGEEFKSKNFGKGGTYSYKLDKPGTIKYVCTIHPGMDATITVTK